MFILGGGEIPKTISARLTTLTTRLFLLLILFFYSGEVLSFLFVRTITPPFYDLDGFVNDGTFKVTHLFKREMEETFFVCKNNKM